MVRPIAHPIAQPIARSTVRPRMVNPSTSPPTRHLVGRAGRAVLILSTKHRVGRTRHTRWIEFAAVVTATAPVPVVASSLASRRASRASLSVSIGVSRLYAFGRANERAGDRVDRPTIRLSIRRLVRVDTLCFFHAQSIFFSCFRLAQNRSSGGTAPTNTTNTYRLLS